MDPRIRESRQRHNAAVMGHDRELGSSRIDIAARLRQSEVPRGNCRSARAPGRARKQSHSLLPSSHPISSTNPLDIRSCSMSHQKLHRAHQRCSPCAKLEHQDRLATRFVEVISDVGLCFVCETFQTFTVIIKDETDLCGPARGSRRTSPHAATHRRRALLWRELGCRAG